DDSAHAGRRRAGHRTRHPGRQTHRYRGRRGQGRLHRAPGGKGGGVDRKNTGSKKIAILKSSNSHILNFHKHPLEVAMHRPSRPTAALVAVSLAILAAAACSGGPEQPILNQFFTASRLRDNTSLQNFSTVAFDPSRDGTVSSFSIVSVTPEEHKPLNVRTFAKALDDARAEDAAYSKRKEEYFAANQEAISRALKAEREKG